MTKRATSARAEAFRLIASGFALLARAEGSAPGPANDAGEWLDPAVSPLGKRRTLELWRAGTLDGAKIGKKVLIKRASLDAFIERHRRTSEDAEDDDLFGIAS
jgi:hypothetical protein